MAKAVFSAVSHSQSVTAPLEDATFVAFRNPSGLNPDGVVWEKADGAWRCVAWDGDDYAPSDVDDLEMDLEILSAVDDGVKEFYFGSNCSREEFFSYVFGHEAETDGAFGSDYDYPPHMEEPEFMYSADGWHYYAFTLDPEQVEKQERELHEELAKADEYVHREMYGSSYKL